MKLFSLKSLRVRLMLLVLVAVIPAWLVIAYNAAEQRRKAVADIQKNVLRLVESSAREEEQVLQGTRQILISLANFIRQTDAGTNACSAFCDDLLRQFSRYANIGAVDSKGNVFCSAIPLDHPINAVDQSWFQRAVTSGDFAVGDFHVEHAAEDGKGAVVLGV